MKPLIVIPTYNEKDNIAKLLGRLLNLDDRLEMLVVDDNSPDGTGQLVESFTREQPRIHLLSREKKNGLGQAYRAGFRWGLERDYDVMIEMDADLSHRPRYIPQFLKTLETYDVAVGSRWVPGGGVANWGMDRILLSRGASLYARTILGVPVRDLTAGFVGYRRSFLEKLNLDEIRSDGYSFQIEMKYRALRNGFTLKEFPIRFTDRKYGKSKISRHIVLEALAVVWVLRFGNVVMSPAIEERTAS